VTVIYTERFAKGLAELLVAIYRAKTNESHLNAFIRLRDFLLKEQQSREIMGQQNFSEEENKIIEK
jgi:hypothetical protein